MYSYGISNTNKAHGPGYLQDTKNKIKSRINYNGPGYLQDTKNKIKSRIHYNMVIFLTIGGTDPIHLFGYDLEIRFRVF